jgi:hypothetical protein
LGEGLVQFDQTPSSYTRTSNHNINRMPKTVFSKFDGDNPQWWKTVIEKYFTTKSFFVNHNQYIKLHRNGIRTKQCRTSSLYAEDVME